MNSFPPPPRILFGHLHELPAACLEEVLSRIEDKGPLRLASRHLWRAVDAHASTLAWGKARQQVKSRRQKADARAGGSSATEFAEEKAVAAINADEAAGTVTRLPSDLDERRAGMPPLILNIIWI